MTLIVQGQCYDEHKFIDYNTVGTYNDYNHGDINPYNYLFYLRIKNAVLWVRNISKMHSFESNL